MSRPNKGRLRMNNRFHKFRSSCKFLFKRKSTQNLGVKYSSSTQCAYAGWMLFNIRHFEDSSRYVRATHFMRFMGLPLEMGH